MTFFKKRGHIFVHQSRVEMAYLYFEINTLPCTLNVVCMSARMRNPAASKAYQKNVHVEVCPVV